MYYWYAYRWKRERVARAAASTTASAVVSIVKMQHPRRSPSVVAGAANQIVNVLLGESIAPDEVQTAAAAAASGLGHDGSLHFALKSRPQVKISYRDDKGELAAINEDVTNNHNLSADIGATAAEARFMAVLSSLAASGTAEFGRVDATAVVRRNVMQWEKSPNSSPVVAVKEYLFVAPQKLNGIPILDAGLTVSVDRGGAIARIIAFGPEVSSASSVAATLTVDDATGAVKVHADFPNYRVEPLGLTYWVPEGDAMDAPIAVEPRYVYRIYSQVHMYGKTSDGMGRYVAYSATTGSIAPLMWPPNSTVTSGDGKP